MTRFRFFLVLIVLAAVFVGGMAMGWRGAQQKYAANPNSAYSLQRELATLKAKLKTVTGELEMAQTRASVDRNALDLVRREIAEHKGLTAELEEELRFYQSLMAPEKGVGGISMRAPEIVPMEQPGVFRVRFTTQQVASKHEKLTGSLSVEIIASGAEDEVALPLSELVEDFQPDDLRLEFRYFQVVDVVLEIPEDVEPLAITASVKIKKPRVAAVDQVFPWVPQEKFKHAGK